MKNLINTFHSKKTIDSRTLCKVLLDPKLSLCHLAGSGIIAVVYIFHKHRLLQWQHSWIAQSRWIALALGFDHALPLQRPKVLKNHSD